MTNLLIWSYAVLGAINFVIIAGMTHAFFYGEFRSLGYNYHRRFAFKFACLGAILWPIVLPATFFLSDWMRYGWNNPFRKEERAYD